MALTRELGAKQSKMEASDMYCDKYGNEIKEGMFLRHDSGDIQLVYPGHTADGKPSLGFWASDTEIYPLHEFRLNEWEICDEPEEWR